MKPPKSSASVVGAASGRDSKASVVYREVDAETAGQRLDNFLLAALKGVPRAHVYRLIRSGQVRVNAGRVEARYRVRHGDKVRIPPVRASAALPAAPEPAGLGWLEQRIIHEDARLLVLDKPAGLAVHGGSRVALGAIEALRSLRPHVKSLELVHRLDRATSGALLVAKRRSALRALHALLRQGRVEKRYLALVRGAWPEGATRVEAPLARAGRALQPRVAVHAAGKAAASDFRLIERFGDLASYVEIVIRTGRTHQIRVHAAHAGHPIAGDERYGDRDFNAALEKLGLERMFLHAHAVAFVWPDSGEEFSASVPLPDELKRVLDAVGDRGAATGRTTRRADRAPPRAKSRRSRSSAGR